MTAPTVLDRTDTDRTETHDIDEQATPVTTPTSPAGGAAQSTGSRLRVTRPEHQRDFPLPSGRPDPLAHLTPEQVEQIGLELDAIHDEVMGSLGAKDAAYIRRVIKVQRSLEFGSRGLLLFSGWTPAWVLGTAALSVAKCLENMEIGHNILHGQWDWMRDPQIHSQSWEWDHPSPAKQWQESHNDGHHTYTNVLDMDNDLGYGILRVDDEQPWTLYNLVQPLVNVANALVFEYGIAAYDIQLGAWLKGEVDDEWFRPRAKAVLRKVGKQALKDYVVHPALSGPNWKRTLAATWVANTVRNVWTNQVIICGHFPEGVETFATDSIEGETRGEWYLRQMVGSANIHGSRLMHIMTGNLSHQIEHHLYPDMPSNRYITIAPRIRELMDRYELTYVTGTLGEQLLSVHKKILRLSLPDKEAGRSRRRIVLDAVKEKLGAGRAALASA